MSEHVREQLVDYLLGETEGNAIERHLQECVQCAGELARLRVMRDALVDAPLDPSPRAELADEVFLRVRHAGTVELLENAPLIPAPDRDLGNRVLNDARLGSLDARRRARLGWAVGAAAVLMGALGVSLFQIDELNERVQGLRTNGLAGIFSGVPEGHSMQTLPVAGEDFDSNVELVHFSHDNYRLQLVAENVPVQSPGHHYELWMWGKDGHSLAGSFRLRWEDDLTFLFNVGIDPAEYNKVQIIEEPDIGGPAIQGEVVATGWIDPAQVEHEE